MIPVFLIVIPLVTGLFSFFLKEKRSAKAFALLSSVATLAVSLISLFQSGSSISTDASWLPMLGSRF
jgi:NADH-quinone oxidoreductase subunit M